VLRLTIINPILFLPFFLLFRKRGGAKREGPPISIIPSIKNPHEKGKKKVKGYGDHL